VFEAATPAQNSSSVALSGDLGIDLSRAGRIFPENLTWSSRVEKRQSLCMVVSGMDTTAALERTNRNRIVRTGRPNWLEIISATYEIDGFFDDWDGELWSFGSAKSGICRGFNPVSSGS